MLQAFTLALLARTGHVQYWHVAVLAVCYGLANTLDMPARQSFIVEMVGKDDLTSAIALNSAMFNGARMIGPAVAGLLVDRFGVAPAFGLNGLSFVAVILALAAMRTEGLPREREGDDRPAGYCGGRPLRRGHSSVALILTLLLVVSLFVINHNVLVPLLARDVLHEGAHGFGLLMAALGIGAVVGALALAMLGRSRPTLPLLITAAAMAAALTLALAAIRHFPAAVVLLALTGLSQIVFMASCNTALQMVVPDRLRGPNHEPVRLRVRRRHADRLVFRGVGGGMVRDADRLRGGRRAGAALRPGARPPVVARLGTRRLASGGLEAPSRAPSRVRPGNQDRLRVVVVRTRKLLAEARSFPYTRVPPRIL